jgi:hypothetical protein
MSLGGAVRAAVPDLLKHLLLCPEMRRETNLSETLDFTGTAAGVETVVNPWDGRGHVRMDTIGGRPNGVGQEYRPTD